MADAKRLSDRRLLGVWKSDRRRTFRHWKPRPGSTPAKLRKFKALFGRMTVRWTRTKCYSNYQGAAPTAVPYRIIARDSESVVVRVQDTLSDEPRLWQIHFEDDGYWIAPGFGLCEYFQRVNRTAK